jgi:hypothetical protein
VAHRLLRILHDAVVACPKDDADILAVSIGDKFLKVDVGIDQEQVGLRSLRPSLVHDDVLDAVRGREVYVVLVGLRVDSSPEIDSVKIPAVPPVPFPYPQRACSAESQGFPLAAVRAAGASPSVRP